MQHRSVDAVMPEVATARRVAAGMARRAAEADSDARLSHESIAALHAAGLLGLTAPVSAGGLGAGLATAAEVIHEIGRADPSVALVAVMHYVNMATLSKGRWDPSLLAQVLRGGAERGELINALRVEPELGTPVRGGLPATIACATADGWCLSGRKIYSTGCTAIHWGLVWAATDEAEPRVGLFLVPMAAEGVTIHESWDTLGLRASASHDVVFDNVQLPHGAAADIRRPGEWARGDDVAAWGNLLIAALYTGVAEAAQDWIAEFLKARVPANLGKPLSELPRQQEAMGGIAARLSVNRRLIRAAAAEVDAGSPLPAIESNIVKLTATENAIAAVEAATKLAGNHAIARRNPLERHLRDVLCGRIHTPQEDTVLVAAGRQALGL
ncbi:acyl-CoA dehydrogenase family protein [Falsirhodobacter xinxiangensis]|uniref:acyl-CoA dehydrogenase family protein n=1 Tax=Falsirhodobacter xinxiangensis TaxID=2530049 RepID=UPI0010AB290C